MKILKVFGVVVAVHAAAFMFVFAIPGCRTTSRPATPPPADTAADAPTVSYPGAAGEAASPVSGDAASPVTPGESPVVSFGAPPAEVPRFNPTRPDSPAAGLLQSGNVSGVIPAKTYTVVSNDSLWKVAKKHGITIGELASANNLRPDTPLKLGQKLIIPGRLPAATSADGTPGPQVMAYKVKAGDSLGTIARRHGTTVTALRNLNPDLKGDSLRAGQELMVPAGRSSGPAAAENPVSAPVTKIPSSAFKHTVRPGESLSQIAKKYGVPLREIAAANNIANPAGLQAGQILMIPGYKASDAAPAPQPEPAPVVPVAPSPVEPAPVSPAPEASPVSPDAPPPPVNKVDEGSPVAPSGN